MRCLIITNASKTIDEENNGNTLMLEYYKGSFRIVSILVNELKIFSNVKTFIFSDKFGLVEGDDKLKEIKQKEQTKKELELEKILSYISNSDTVVILLTSKYFKKIIKKNWKQITSRAKNNSTWCLGASPSNLRSLSFENLKSKGVELIIYKRKGVAPLGKESKRQLIDTLKKK